jgi:hypothetical protein
MEVLFTNNKTFLDKSIWLIEFSSGCPMWNERVLLGAPSHCCNHIRMNDDSPPDHLPFWKEVLGHTAAIQLFPYPNHAARTNFNIEQTDVPGARLAIRLPSCCSGHMGAGSTLGRRLAVAVWLVPVFWTYSTIQRARGSWIQVILRLFEWIGNLWSQKSVAEIQDTWF